MPRTKRKSPVEDVESAVADIVNSPITRSNLSFLVRPGVGNAGESANGPSNVEVPPTGLRPTSGGLIKGQEGSSVVASQSSHSEGPWLDAAATSEPRGFRPPMGLEPVGVTPTGPWPTHIVVESAFMGPATRGANDPVNRQSVASEHAIKTARHTLAPVVMTPADVAPTH